MYICDSAIEITFFFLVKDAGCASEVQRSSEVHLLWGATDLQILFGLWWVKNVTNFHNVWNNILGMSVYALHSWKRLFPACMFIRSCTVIQFILFRNDPYRVDLSMSSAPLANNMFFRYHNVACIDITVRIRAAAINYFSNRVFYRLFHRLIE